jgi:hypothetical protein
MREQDSINFAVRSLDLRSVKKNSLDARRQVRLERSHALSAITSAGGGASSVPPPSVSFSSSFQQNLQQQKYGGGGAPQTGHHRQSLSASAASHSSGAAGHQYSSAAGNTAEARLAAATATAAVVEVSNLNNRIEALEACLASTIRSFTQLAISADGAMGSRSPHYAVTFGPGPIGMILTAREGSSGSTESEVVESIDVAELRDDAEGRPLLAKASGRIAVGDSVIAINGKALARFGPPSLEGVAAEFKAATRPVTVLFERHS